LYSPSMSFRFDNISFWLVNPDAMGEEAGDPLNPISERSLRDWVETPGTITFLGMKLPVIAVRVYAVALLTLGIGLFIYLWYYINRMTKTSQDADIRMRYSPMMIDILNHQIDTRKTVIDVASIHDLARLAERNSSMILHISHSSGMHTYLVQDENSIYRAIITEPHSTLDEKQSDEKQE
jgi:hypothetical protein